MRAVRMTLFTAVLLFFGTAPAVAQNTGTVTGAVTNETTGEPMAGVQVLVAGTNIGTITGENGRYILRNVPAGQQTIRATFIGFSRGSQTVAVPAGGTATVDFQLHASAIELEGLVVSAATGREQRQRELGTNVTSINIEDLNPAPITSLAEALGGRSSGVVMQDVGGTTGTSQRIRIRGANSLNLSNEPLIFVDGVRIDQGQSGFGVGGQEPSRLNDLNPSDIANIEVVKGPAASAMYGTAAANGVLLITTKRGRPGATQWSAFVEQGTIDDKNDYPTNWAAIEILDENEPLFREEGTFAGFLNSDAARFCPNIQAAQGNCTQDRVLSFNTLRDARTTPFISGSRQRYGASARGGNETVRYFVSGQYEEEQGVISYNQLEKLNFRANLDADLLENVDLAVSFGYADSGLMLNSNDNSIFSPLINGLLGYPNFIPADTARDTGAPVNDLNYGFGFNMEELSFLPAEQDVDRFTTSTNMRWRPTSWLMINGQAGLDLVNTHDFETLQPDRLPIARVYRLGYRQSRRATDYVYTGVLSGVGTFNLMRDLVSTTTVGTQYTRDNRETTYCFGSSLVPGTASCGTTASDFSISEGFFEVRTIGGYVQQELGWRDRLFVRAGLRADDNSAFGKDFKLAYYPSADVSWIVAEEPWFPETNNILSALKLRAAYGVSGLRPGFRQATTLFAPTTVATPTGDAPGVSLSVTGNPQLKPERSREYEFGFDAGLFNDRLGVDFTYFDKQSEDALIRRPLAPSLGVTGSVLANLGSVQNKGTELGLNLTAYESRNFGVNLGFTNSTVRNEVVELGEGIEPIIFNRGQQRHEEGFSAGAFFQTPYEWNDANGDGLLSVDEVSLVRYQEGDDIPEGFEVGDIVEDQFIGPSLPKWQRTIFADVRLFGFMTVSALFEGRGGHHQVNYTESFRCRVFSTRNCSAVANPDASLEEQARHIANTYYGSNFGYIEEADFYRWREASVSLMTPANLAQRFQQLEGLRLTIAGRNLGLWTDYTGLDPEANESGGSSNFTQGEFNTQPPVRTITFRLDYSF